MKVQVCVGSSCHLKGSYEIIQLLKEKVKNGLEDCVDLSATFCLGKCGISGVSVQVDEEIITGITTENFENFFNEKIIGKLEKDGKMSN